MAIISSSFFIIEFTLFCIFYFAKILTNKITSDIFFGITIILTFIITFYYLVILKTEIKQIIKKDKISEEKLAIGQMYNLENEKYGYITYIKRKTWMIFFFSLTCILLSLTFTLVTAFT